MLSASVQISDYSNSMDEVDSRPFKGSDVVNVKIAHSNNQSPKLRKNFPETWLWEQNSDQNGFVITRLLKHEYWN